MVHSDIFLDRHKCVRGTLDQAQKGSVPKSLCGDEDFGEEDFFDTTAASRGLVHDDPLGETRRRFAERKEELNGFESNDAGGATARGDPASMRSWLSCRCMVEIFFPTRLIENTVNRRDA